jgi:hypothetical protein
MSADVFLLGCVGPTEARRVKDGTAMRSSKLVLVALVVTASAVVGCSANEPATSTATREWQATNKTAAALGVTRWSIKGEERRAELSGYRAGDVVVVHGTLSTIDERLTVDFDQPTAWHFDVKRGQVPTTSGELPPKVGIALAGTALELFDARLAPSTRSLTTGGVRPQSIFGGGGSLYCGTGSLFGSGPSYTGVNVPYNYGLLSSRLGGTCNAVYSSSAACIAASQQYSACPNWASNLGSMLGMGGDPVSSVLNAFLADQQQKAAEKDLKDQMDKNCNDNGTTYYLDNDKDGYGGTQTKKFCGSPDSGWVEKDGDCDDNNADVHPGQVAFFDHTYQNGNAAPSWDYDCSGSEEQSTSSVPRAATCTLSADKSACAGEGYIVAPGASICGSTRYRTCTIQNTGTDVALCQTTDGDAAAVTCR